VLFRSGNYPQSGVPSTGYYQQPVGYGMGTGNPQAYVFVQPTALTNPPDDHMCYSIFVTICCCWLIGIFAIMKSSECRNAIRLGNRPEAELKSAQAKKYSNIGLGLGIVTIIMSIVFFGIYFGLIVSRHY